MAKRARPSLRSYRAKRDFRVTPEPRAAAAPAKRGRRARGATFMVHKHDARRLHYDLRLEMDGVLASWSVPKGPSFDPRVKRLAVQTEDHPLAYGAFEGRIPEGEYGAGDSIIWDRGTWETIPPGEASAMRRKGHLHFELHGEKLRGRWHLIRTRGDASGKETWLLFKSDDEAARADFDVTEARPESVVSGRRITRGPTTKKSLEAPHPKALELMMKVWPPMLATLVEQAPSRGEWIHEVKYDGFRALAALSGGDVALQSRNGLDLSGRFPRIFRALKDVIAAEAVLDGEIVAVDAKGRSRFQALQQSGGALRYFVFDLLWLDGRDLRARPLRDRRELLESLLANVGEPIVLAERLVGGGERALAEAKRRGLEGVIAKRADAPYEGRRSRDWLKLKVLAGQEMAIVGFTPISYRQPAAGRNPQSIGALLLAVREGDRFVYAGKVGTGFTDKLRRELFRLLSNETAGSRRVEGAPRFRDAIWVEPRHVAQIELAEWTADGKARHPSFQGLRPDKRPEECVREAPQPAPASEAAAAPPAGHRRRGSKGARVFDGDGPPAR